jgi:hypothetical protein
MGGTAEPLSEEKNEAIRSRYTELMVPLFFPEDPVGHDIVRYFASLLRIIGMEDKGWDPYLESRAVLDDLYNLARLDLPEERFPNKDFTGWRRALLFYKSCSRNGCAL